MADRHTTEHVLRHVFGTCDSVGSQGIFIAKNVSQQLAIAATSFGFSIDFGLLGDDLNSAAVQMVTTFNSHFKVRVVLLYLDDVVRGRDASTRMLCCH